VDIEAAIRRAGLAFEEWEVLFREFLLVERRMRLAALGRPDNPDLSRAR
jgi:hypothetical protein